MTVKVKMTDGAVALVCCDGSQTGTTPGWEGLAHRESPNAILAVLSRLCRLGRVSGHVISSKSSRRSLTLGLLL